MPTVKFKKHLQAEQGYIDRYDKMTVDYCRDTVRVFEKRDNLDLKKDVDEKTWQEGNRIALELFLLFECGEWYLKKEATIQSWIERDQAIDDLLEKAKEPTDIPCLSCDQSMRCTSKIHYDNDDRGDRVLFFLRCDNKSCKRGRAFFNDGEEFLPEPHLCSKCGVEMDDSDKRRGMIITTTYTCPSCSHIETENMDLAVKKEKPDPDFERDRARFCFTKEKGEQWRREKQGWEELIHQDEEIKERNQNKDLYDAAEKLKKLTIDELEKKLQKVLSKKSFEKLSLGEPQMVCYVVVPFTVRDTNKDRSGRSSELELQKVLRRNLEKTNWRLMSEGVSYRLGVLSGRLKGYEDEADLLKLVKKIPFGEGMVL